MNGSSFYLWGRSSPFLERLSRPRLVATSRAAHKLKAPQRIFNTSRRSIIVSSAAGQGAHAYHFLLYGKSK